jgi:hypothetical protein
MRAPFRFYVTSIQVDQWQTSKLFPKIAAIGLGAPVIRKLPRL